MDGREVSTQKRGLPPGRKVPDPHHPVLATRGETLTVGAERHAPDVVPVCTDGGVPPVRWTPERLVGIVRLGGKDAPPCQGDRTFRSRTRRSSGVKLLSWSAGRAGH